MSDKGLTDFERAMLEQSKAQTEAMIRFAEAQERTLALASADERRASNDWTEAAEKNARAIESSARIGAARSQELHRVSIPCVLAQCEGEPTVSITVSLDCVVLGPSEERPGARRVIRFVDVDWREADDVLRADIAKMHEGSLREAERLGSTEAIRALNAHIEGRSADGLRFRRSMELYMPAMRRVIGKYLDDLLRVGTVRLVEPAVATE